MRKLNQLGGGIVFEAMVPADIDAFMKQCAERAGMGADTDEDNETTIINTPGQATAVAV